LDGSLDLRRDLGQEKAEICASCGLCTDSCRSFARYPTACIQITAIPVFFCLHAKPAVDMAHGAHGVNRLCCRTTETCLEFISIYKMPLLHGKSIRRQGVNKPRPSARVMPGICSADMKTHYFTYSSMGLFPPLLQRGYGTASPYGE